MVNSRVSLSVILVLVALAAMNCQRVTQPQTLVKVYEPTWNSLGSHTTPPVRPCEHAYVFKIKRN